MQIAHLEFKLDDSILTMRKLRIRIGEADVNLYMDRVARKLRGTSTAPGFRRGKAPLFVVRKHYPEKIAAEAFEELKRVALDQILKEVREEDRPFLPPEVEEREKVRLRYGQPLEFSLRYLVDPSGIGNRPEAKHDEFDPLSELHERAQRRLPTGIPAGPGLPHMPGAIGPGPKVPK